MSGDEERQRILRFWWLLELFSPQSVPRPTPRAAGAADRQVIEWRPGDPLPWKVLPTPRRVGAAERAWRHTVYLGVYDLELTYDSLQRAFGEDTDAYDERSAGCSAAAGLLVGADGVLAAGSAVLSSALWAVGRIEMHGIGDPEWAAGFPEAAKAFREAVDEHEGGRPRSRGHSAPAQDSDSLTALTRLAHELQGVSGRPELATPVAVIQSVAVSVRRQDDPADIDFLNSLFLDDLAAVRAALAEGHGGKALTEYLTSEGRLDESARVDVVLDHAATEGGVVVERLPLGRWPSTPEHGLSLRQQFAVNRALVDLGPGRGLMAVNGPPGTGKTTMLRDILAGNVVERARRLAALERAEDVFGPETHSWKTGDGPRRTLRELRPEVTGFEMVVASANNAAVENVTAEIPARKAIDPPWSKEADYFADIAREVLAASTSRSDGDEPVDAWGLVAARLGNKRNRSAFQSAFWFDGKDSAAGASEADPTRGMLTVLKEWRDGAGPPRSWKDARVAFAGAERRVEALLEQRREQQARRAMLPRAVKEQSRIAEVVTSLRSRLDSAKAERIACDAAVDDARALLESVEVARERIRSQRPGLLATIMSLGRSRRDWRAELSPVEASARAAGAARDRERSRLAEIDDRGERLDRGLASARRERAQATESLVRLRQQLAADEEQVGAGYPGEEWTGDARELRAPWLDPTLDAARSDLFLAALDLHRDLLANTAAEMIPGLRAALDVVVGGGPRGLEPATRRAAWQLFFLVVPLVSTTFASLGRIFGDIGPESIGWLLVDEAGQACPQYAAGAIWRARRVVAVGDPLQLEPVVTMPRKAQRDIASAFGLNDTWIPPQASVQTLADRVSLHGTTLTQADRQVWVSAPLTVHRRCDDPMFSLCNAIAYNGIMVNGVKRDLEDPEEPDLFDSAAGPRIVTSRWIDEAAPTSGTHLQENQIARLESGLAYLKGLGVPPSRGDRDLAVPRRRRSARCIDREVPGAHCGHDPYGAGEGGARGVPGPGRGSELAGGSRVGRLLRQPRQRRGQSSQPSALSHRRPRRVARARILPRPRCISVWRPRSSELTSLLLGFR
ncbi:AAA family ATPase [Rathayibacter festucae]|uniref:AAA family ATPase n=1 Tax=Rathayibacter festucae TaxID=110937 RepID=UPI002A6B4704|nr:AAA family ATPase [Rathayibacter festucae]MDY0911310.1 AAA family ATPase [Rathayibacter festucae]